jgi:hypothetical protein
MRRPIDFLYNFHWIVPGEAARGGQAHIGRLGPFLRRHGLRALINLRGQNPDIGWWRYETRIARETGVAHLDVMLDSRKLPTRAMVATLFDAFDAAPKPFLVKCSGGQDRTSLAAALYLVHRGGWEAMAEAEAQFARFPYLHFPKRHQRWLKPFLLFAREDSRGAPVAQWARETYDPATLKTWLEARGLAETFAGLFVVPTRSRWQW